MDFIYDDMLIQNAYRADIIVNNKLIIGLKAVKEIIPEHHSQINTYMALSKIPYRLLINFHARFLKEQMFRKNLDDILEFRSNSNTFFSSNQ